MEQLPYGDAARHVLVSRLLTKYLFQVTPSYRFCYKIFFLKIFGCSNGKSTTGWCRSVLSKSARGDGFGGRKYGMVLVYMKDGRGRVKERKEE